MGFLMFGADTLARFRDRLSEGMTRDLQLDASFSWRMARDVTEMIAARGAEAFTAVRARLAEWDIGVQWQHVLREERARAVAEWVEPFARGTVLDLLGGAGRAAEMLAELGPEVIVLDKEKPAKGACPLPFFHLRSPRETSLPHCDTVLFCQVLSREEDPEWLLSMASRTSARRLLIVENVVEPEHPRDVLELMDLFFERCLPSPSVAARARTRPRHRPLETWLSPLVSRGAIAAIERRPSLPGVPLSHALIAVDLPARGRP
jgi:hypothetical protein